MVAAFAAEPAALAHRPVERAVEEQPGGAGGEPAFHVGPAAEALPGRVQRDAAAVVAVVEHQLRAVAREGEAEHRGVVGRRDLGDDAVVEGDAIGVRVRRLVRVTETQRARRPVRARRTAGDRGRHQLEGLPVAHPRARFVRQRERFQPRAVVDIVALLVLVHPVRAGIGHRRPEVEAVRHGHRGKVVAAREASVGIGTAAGVDEVAGAPARIGGRGAEAQVVQVALEAGGRTIVHQHDALDRAPGGDRAHVDRQVVPLVRIQRAAVALRARRGADPVLVARAAGGQPAAVVEQQVHRDVGGRIAQVARVRQREDQVRQPRIRPYRQVHRVQLRLLLSARVAAVMQRAQAAEADAGFGGERGRLAGAAGHVDAERGAGQGCQRRRFRAFERAQEARFRRAGREARQQAGQPQTPAQPAGRMQVPHPPRSDHAAPLACPR